MLSWEEFDEKEKETQLVKPKQYKKEQKAPVSTTVKEEKEQPRVALSVGNSTNRLERAKKAIEQFDQQIGEEALEGMGSRVDVDQKAMINCRADVNH